jgi:hypothetical protein
MEWLSRKTSIAGVQIPNWMVVLGAVIVILLSRVGLTRNCHCHVYANDEDSWCTSMAGEACGSMRATASLVGSSGVGSSSAIFGPPLGAEAAGSQLASLS